MYCKSASQKRQHLQCEKHVFPLFFRKTAIFADEKELVAMKATVIERDCKSPCSTPANCKFAGTEEEDLETPYTVTLTGKYENKETGTFVFGGTLQFSVSDNGPIGFTSVYYWDDPFSTNQYTINGFKWSFKPAVIPIPIH